MHTAETHWLDSLPFDYSQPAARELLDLLAVAYDARQRVRQLVASVAISPALLNWEQPLIDVWHDLLPVARSQDKLRLLLDRVLEDPTAVAYHPRFRELIASAVVEAPGPSEGVSQSADWINFDDPESLERQLGDRSTLLDIAFLEQGLRVAPAVARLTVSFGPGRTYYGTAFRIRPDLLLTNYHVLFDVEREGQPAEGVEIWFGYERDFAGRDRAHSTVEGDISTITGERTHDWAVIAPTTELADTIPILPLGPSRMPAADELVYIIQHPQGGPKQIGMYNNLIRYVDDNVIQYYTDTMSGSSGSPVFNDRWEVIGLHHRWVEARGRLGRREYRNQGRRIEKVIAGIRAAGRPPAVPPGT